MYVYVYVYDICMYILYVYIYIHIYVQIYRWYNTAKICIYIYVYTMIIVTIIHFLARFLVISNRNSNLSRNSIDNNNNDNNDVYRRTAYVNIYIDIQCVAYVLINLLFAAGNTEGTASYAYVICILYVCAWKPSDLGLGGVTIQNKDGFNTITIITYYCY